VNAQNSILSLVMAIHYRRLILTGVDRGETSGFIKRYLILFRGCHEAANVTAEIPFSFIITTNIFNDEC
jgi:hypothetical protein